MPLIKKLIKLGNSSRAVVIPSGWLNYYEKKMGCTIENVLLTVKGDNIIIAVDNSLPGMVATKECPLCGGTKEVIERPPRLMGATYPENDPYKGDEHLEPCPLCEQKQRSEAER